MLKGKCVTMFTIYCAEHRARVALLPPGCMVTYHRRECLPVPEQNRKLPLILPPPQALLGSQFYQF